MAAEGSAESVIAEVFAFAFAPGYALTVSPPAGAVPSRFLMLAKVISFESPNAAAFVTVTVVVENEAVAELIAVFVAFTMSVLTVPIARMLVRAIHFLKVVFI